MFDKQSFGLRTTTKGRDRIVWLRNLLLLITLSAGALAVLYFSRQAAAANITWNGLGGDSNWSTGANWVGGVAPAGSGDLAIFDGTSSKNATIDIDVNIGSIEIDSGYTGAITQAAGKNIALSTQSACAGAAGFCQNGGTFTLTSGSMFVQGNYNQSGGAFNVGNDVFTEVNNFEPTGGSFNGGTGTINMQARLELKGTAQFTATKGTLTINGDFKDDVAGTAFTHNDGTVTFTGPFFGSSLPISLKAGGETFNNLNFNLDNGKTCNISGGPLTVQGSLQLNDGLINNGTLQVPAPVPVTVSANFDGTTFQGVLLFTGAAARTVTFAAGANLLNVDLNASGTTINTSGSGTLTFPSLTLEAGIINQGGADFFIIGNYNQSGGTFNVGSGLFTEQNNFEQTGGNFNGGSGTIDMQSRLELKGTAQFTSTTGTLTINGDFKDDVAGTAFTHNNGTVTFTGPFFGNSLPISLKAGGESFNNLNFNLDDGKTCNLSGGALTVQGSLQLNDGFVNNSVLSPQGNVLVAATFDGGTTAVTFAGTTNQTFTNNGGANLTGTWTVDKSSGKVVLASNLVLNGGQTLSVTSGTLDQGASFNLQTSNTLSIGASGTLRDFGTGDLTLGGSLSNNGVFNFNGGGTACGDPSANHLQIFSTSAGTSRIWSGSGTFSVVDVDVQDQDATAIAGGITAFGSSSVSNSPNWTLNSGCPISVTTQPGNTSACPGGSANFTVGVSGLSPTFQWRKNGTPLSNGGNISGANSATLTINPVGAGDAASTPGYDAVGTNAFGVTATTNAATLTLKALPMITSNPAATAVCEGQPASLSANASGNGITFQWRKNGSPLSNGGRITGANSPTLSINPTVAGDDDNYDVVATGDCSPAATSSAAHLTINTAPAISSQPTNQTACESGSANFTVAATGTGLSFQWRRNGTPLSNGGNISGATTATLTINPVSTGDANSYDVVINGTCSPSLTSTARTLTVNTAPGITTQPNNQTFCEGATASFTAAASGSPGPTVQWQVSTDGGANFNDIGGATSTTLSFTASASQNGNKFRARFTNTCNTVATTAATLTVNTAPAVSTNPQDATFCEGATASFTAAAGGSPSPTVQWQVSTDGGANFNDIGGATSTTLSFTASASQNGNKFRAIFTNACAGATSNVATLTVNGFALSSNSQMFTFAGGSSSVNVMTGATCGWTAVSNDPSFIHITGGTPGTGNGTVDFSVDSTLSPRTGTMTIAGQTFTVDQSTPTAANGNVSGQIVDSNGNPVEGAAVRMSGTQNRLTVTDAAGNYHFDNVETNGFYTVVPTRVNFTFTPSQRAFSQLGQHTDAAFSATPTGNALNPLDTTEYFVRQQYVDFLNREPDESGFNFWVNNIESCGNDANCRAVKRIDTSAAFFLSIEFQQTGYLVYRTYQAAYGDLPNAPVPIRRNEFKPDTAEIGNGVVVLQSGWQARLESNTQAFVSEFVQRARFVSAYPATMTPAEFVDKLFTNAGVTPGSVDRAAAIDEFGSASISSDVAARGRALRRVAENSVLAQQEFNQAFVLMEYFGYLQRDADTGPDTDFTGYNFWLDKLNTFGGNFQNAEMVKAFLVSGEYRGRFPR